MKLVLRSLINFRRVAVFSIGLGLVVAIGYLAVVQVRAQVAIQESAQKQAALDSERRATALSYFFSEQKDCLKDLAESRALYAYFENQALGMSLEYGLQASLLVVNERFDQVRQSKKLGELPLYERIAFVNAAGLLLNESPPQGQEQSGRRDWQNLLTPHHSESAILCDRNAKELRILISSPCFFKGKYAGQVLGWISFHQIYHYFIEGIGGTSRYPDAIVFEREYLHVPPRARRLIPSGESVLPANIGPGHSYELPNADGNTTGRGAHAMLVPVKATPFSLMTFIPSMEQLDFQSPRKVIIMAGGFSLLFIAAMFTLMRLNTNNALLRTHLQETLLREKVVDEKNRELAAEIQVRQTAESALRDSEERYRAVAQSAHDAIVTIDHTGNIVGWNRGAERIFGYEAAAIIDQPLTRLMPERYRDAHSFGEDRIKLGGAPNIRGQATELQGLRKDGSEFPAEISLAKWDALDTWFVTGIIRDITDRKHAEEESAKLQAQLLQSQKMESLGTLAGGIAHDMNNILGAILGLASVNIEGQPQGSQAYRSFETIAKAATRGGEMVRSLLAFARQSQAEDRVLDVNAILQEEIRLLERTTFSKVRLVVNLAPKLHPIRGDASALTHAFMNLCVNAVDAMPENGTLTLRTRNIDSDWIEVTVEDTGTGMPKDVLERAMDPFFTTKGVGKGTGLGLSMVYSAVKAHQGQIEIHSEPGQGTQVRMQFPACEPAIEVAESVPGTRSEMSKRALNVLLVDDDEMIQSSVETILQSLGHAVITTPNGEEALARIETGFVPDVVILDMNMPGLGGSGTLPRLRAILPEVPVLLSTGRTDQVALDLAKTHPFVTLLPKPFSIKELQQRLETIGR